MALTIEWRRRVDHWRNRLQENFYQPLTTLALEGFVTREQLTPEQARRGRFRPMPAGTAWGAKWEYGWFRTQVVTPKAAAGQRLALNVEAGGEGLVFVNGKAAGGRDWPHAHLTLARRARPGERFSVLIEAYAGHGPTPCGGGPVTPAGRVSVPEPPPTQVTVGQTTVGIWQEDVYQLWVDFETLVQLRDGLDQNALRVSEIDQALRDVTCLVDLELPLAAMRAGVRAARTRLQPLLACVNGSTAPVLYAYGHSHLDVAWLWPLAETERKCGRTFSTQLALMAEYPEYKFLQSQAHLLWMTKRRHPELYRRIRAAVRAGRFIPEGSMWVEADTNLAGGESLIRQFLHGKQFFRDEFGVDNELMWLPDVFGYSGNLPQLMRGCGINYFSTAKIFWNYNGGDPFPYNTFAWVGIDGTEVLAHFCNDYNSQTRPTDVLSRWNERVQKDGIRTRLMPFGHGDGGGGPTRDHLEFLRRARNLEGLPQVRLASPLDYFKDLERAGTAALPRYVGELYYQCHRGTYTSQARTKRGNRFSEMALRDAELWAAAAMALAGFKVPYGQLQEAWRQVLLNQFHDIIPGSSIHRVYEEAEAGYARVIARAADLARAAARKLAARPRGLTVFNSLNWPRTELVELPAGVAGATDADGAPLPAQRAGGRTLVEVAVPACGWTSLRPTSTAAPRLAGHLTASVTRLENECLRLTFNGRGEIVSILDKASGRELAAGACNAFRMFKDVPSWFDAWDIDSTYELTPVELPARATVQVVSTGPLVARLRVRRELHQSVVTQEISLRRGARRVEFHTVVDWRERHKLLKVAFPVAIHATEAVHEIQFGHLRRPNHRSRPFDSDRFEVAQQKWTALAEENRGVAVLNDCKYGINVLGNSINLTLLRAPLAPDMTADQGRQEFTYAFYAWNGSLADSGVVRAAYELNCPVTVQPGDAGTRSLFGVDAPNIVIETVKPAEDHSGDVIVRLYESGRMATRCTLQTSLPVKAVQATNLIEEGGTPVRQHAGAIPLDFRAFEIKTLRLHCAGGR